MGGVAPACCCFDAKDTKPVVVSQVVPLQGDASVRPAEARPEKVEPHSYELFHDRLDEAAKWGLEMHWSKHTGTVVQAILPGIVNDWNEKRPLEEQVQPGHIVKSVNDETDPRVMADLLATRTGEFRIRFQAPLMALV
mmetsp:Transcript_6169/g.10740  ORF Transcript_6169/g.10740 Transcript_6169/m.10740 type:complete len:138 (-) Transcript_6169:90-503(-)